MWRLAAFCMVSKWALGFELIGTELIMTLEVSTLHATCCGRATTAGWAAGMRITAIQTYIHCSSIPYGRFQVSATRPVIAVLAAARHARDASVDSHWSDLTDNCLALSSVGLGTARGDATTGMTTGRGAAAGSRGGCA